MSELALKRIKEAIDKRLTRLDLGNCGLTELPDAVLKFIEKSKRIIEISRRNLKYGTH